MSSSSYAARPGSVEEVECRSSQDDSKFSRSKDMSTDCISLAISCFALLSESSSNTSNGRVVPCNLAPGTGYLNASFAISNAISRAIAASAASGIPSAVCRRLSISIVEGLGNARCKTWVRLENSAASAASRRAWFRRSLSVASSSDSSTSPFVSSCSSGSSSSHSVSLGLGNEANLGGN